MADVLIRNVPERTIVSIDTMAARQQLSRSEFLRRQIDQIAGAAKPVAGIDWDRFTQTYQDLADPEIMGQAWR